MKILVYGAGVIGTLYAARLSDAGHRVSVLARGQRMNDIRQQGLHIEDVTSGLRSQVAVNVVDGLAAGDRYDLALIAVRRDQLSAVLPELTANPNIPILLFMLNNPLGVTELIERFPQRVMLGFPGAGGTRAGLLVRYAMIAQQPTLIGEPGGGRTPRLRRLMTVFRGAGFKTNTATDMDGWLKSHAFFVTAISGAIYLAGDTHRLSRDDAALRLMAQGVREGYAAVRALGHSVSPFALKILFTWTPLEFCVRYWRGFFASDMADYVLGRHALAASTEMREIARDCRKMLEMTGVRAVALPKLYAAIDDYAERHADAHP